MDSLALFILAHLLGGALAGSLIGLERTYHGRPAGFRTHVLVCTASSLLMLLSTAEAARLSGLPAEALRVDPARMAQGIMTGIGFLGAGVIMKDRFSVRGLTPAASIWMTAAIGIIIGSGFYYTGAAATLALGGCRPLASMNARSRSSDRSLIICLRSALSRGGSASGGSSPKLLFIGWKCSGSALVM